MKEDSMKIGKSVLKKYFEYSLGVWLNSLLSFFTIPIISWLVQPQEFGKVAMYSSILGGLSSIVQMGTSDAYMRFYNEYSDINYLTTICLIPQILVFLPVAVLVAIFRIPLEEFIQGDVGGFLWVILIVHLLLNVFNSLSITMIRMNGSGLIFSLFNIINNAFSLILTILFCFLVEKSYRSIIMSQLLSTILYTILLLFCTHKQWTIKKPKVEDVKEIFYYSWPLLFGSFLWWMTNWTDRIMLRTLSNFDEIGMYSIASKVASTLNLVVSGFNTLWYPFAYSKMGNENVKQKFVLVADTVTLVMFFLAELLFVGRKVIFQVLFANSYEKASELVGVLLIPIVMTALMVVTGRGINYAKKTYLSIITNTSSITTNVVLNWFLIPRLGAFGAAVGTAVSFVVIFSVEFILSQKFYKLHYNVMKMYIILIFYFSLNFLSLVVNTELEIILNVFFSLPYL